MSVLRKLYGNLEEYLCVFFVALIVVSLSVQVIVRFTLGEAVAWAEEISRFALIWTVYVGAAMAAKRTLHVRVSVQFMAFSPKVRLVFRVLADSVWIVFNLIAAYVCAQVVADSFSYPEVSPTLRWTTAYVEMIIPISCLAVIWRTIEVYIVHLRKGTLCQMVTVEEELGS